MSTTLDNIWDEELAPSNSNSNPPDPPPADISDDEALPSTAKRRSTKLFLSSESEGEDTAQNKPKPPTTRELSPGIEALFDDIDDVDDGGFQELAPSLDLASLRKQADARVANTTLLKSGPVVTTSTPDIGEGNDSGFKKKGEKDKDDGVVKRKQIPRLNETVLLSDQGFPALVKQAKKFKPKGKGHELTDLNRILQVYNFWSHDVFPKGQFKDNVQRIEKLCHSKRMHVALSVWHDEAKGLVNGRKIDDPIDLTSGSEDGDGSDKEGEGAPSKAPEEGRSSPPTIPPSSAYNSTAEEDDVDMDAFIQEQHEIHAASSRTTQTPRNDSVSRTSTSRPVPEITDEDEAMWAQLGDFEDFDVPAPTLDRPVNQPPRVAAPLAMDDDEDMWDVVREMEMEEENGRTSKATPSNIADSNGPTSGPTEGQPVVPVVNPDDDWDGMYAELDPE